MPLPTQPRVLMLVMSDVVHDARVTREADTLSDAGYDVHIIGLGESDSAGDREWTATMVGASSGLPAGRALGPIGRAGRWLLLPWHRRRKQAAFRRQALDQAPSGPFAVVHAHDLPMLPAAAALAEQHGARLAYDAHECWTGTQRSGRPAPLQRRSDGRVERDLGGRADVVIAVSPGLAEWLSGRYGWPHVRVVRNTFPALAREAAPPHPRRLIYAGRIGPGRDLATVVSAGPELPLPVTLIGGRDPNFALPADGTVTVRPPVAPDRLPEIFREHGLALVTLADNCLNHRIALPNKLFQAVQAGVPVVAADLPEIRRVVTSHNLGTLYRPGDRTSLVEAVKAAIADYGTLVTAVEAAAPALSWEVDAGELLDLYDRLAPTVSAH